MVALAGRSSLTVDRDSLPESERRSLQTWRRRIPAPTRPSNLRDRIAEVLPSSYEAILDETRLRILSREAALGYWKDWVKGR